MTTNLIDAYWRDNETHLKEKIFYEKMFQYGCSVVDFTFHDLHPECWTEEEKNDIFSRWSRCFEMMFLFHLSTKKEASERMLTAFFEGDTGLQRLSSLSGRFPPLSSNATLVFLKQLQPTWTPTYSTAWLSTPGFNDKFVKTMFDIVHGRDDLLEPLMPLITSKMKRVHPLTLLQYAQVQILTQILVTRGKLPEAPQWSIQCTAVQKKRLERCAIQALKEAKKIPYFYKAALHNFEVLEQRSLGSTLTDTLALLVPYCNVSATPEDEIDLVI